MMEPDVLRKTPPAGGAGWKSAFLDRMKGPTVVDTDAEHDVGDSLLAAAAASRGPPRNRHERRARQR